MSKKRKIKSGVTKMAVCIEWEIESDDKDSDQWIVCDTCSERFHLHRSGLQYKKGEYWSMSLDDVEFECRVLGTM